MYCTSVLPFACVIGNTMKVECPKHLNAQNSIQQEEKQQKDRDAPNLFPRSPTKRKEEMSKIQKTIKNTMEKFL